MGLKTIPVVQGVGEKEEQKEGWGSLRKSGRKTSCQLKFPDHLTSSGFPVPAAW